MALPCGTPSGGNDECTTVEPTTAGSPSDILPERSSEDLEDAPGYAVLGPAPPPRPSKAHLLAKHFHALLLVGRLAEAEQLAEEAAEGNASGDFDPRLVAWLQETLSCIREASPSMDAPPEKNGWSCMPLDDIGMKVYVRRRDIIDIQIVVNLPATLEQVLVINWEPDLAMQWLPFNPKVELTKSMRTSSILMRVTAKLPILSTREVYVYRTIVDCSTPEAEVAGRRGLMVVEKSPENWRTGGPFQEFTVLPPSESRWVTRDEQRQSVTFYEALDPKTVRTTLSYQLNINIPRWLFPDAALHFLAKATARQYHYGLMRALADFERLGYSPRHAASSHHIYKEWRRQRTP